MENPQDAVSLVGALRSPFCNLSDEALVLLAAARGRRLGRTRDEAQSSPTPAADQRPAAERAIDLLTGWRRLKDRLPIARLLEPVFADSGYDAALQFEFLGDRKLANLWKLIDLARTFDRTGLFGLHEFIARLGDLVSRPAARGAGRDAARERRRGQADEHPPGEGAGVPGGFVPDVAATRQGDRSAVVVCTVRGCLVKYPVSSTTSRRSTPVCLIRQRLSAAPPISSPTGRRP